MPTDTINIRLKDIKCSCITGLAAFLLLLNKAIKLGFKTDCFRDLCIEINKSEVIFTKPKGYHLELYCDDIKDVYNSLGGDPSKDVFYERMLDKISRRVLLVDKDVTLINNKQKITSHKHSENLYYSNLQVIMYLSLLKINNPTLFGLSKQDILFYKTIYITCRNIIKWSINKLNEDNQDMQDFTMFFPTYEVYGDKNINDSYEISKLKFDVNNGTRNRSDLITYKQPSHVYDSSLKNKTIPKVFYGNFRYKDSCVFNLDGKQIKPFL
jgi:hypothetical protein